MLFRSYKLLKETINLNFNKEFKQIKYLQFSSKENDNSNMYELDCNKVKIKFSKAKSSINVYKENCKFFIFYIKQIDNEKCNYVYYIKDNEQNMNENEDIKNINENESEDEEYKEYEKYKEYEEYEDLNLIGIGISKLFNGGFEEKTIEKKWECPIKNRNIFANIKKKRN